MFRTALTAGLLLAALGAAEAQRPIKILEESYELELTSITFPTGPAASVIVKPCPECTNVIHRVDAATVYLLNRSPVSFEDFMLMVDERRRTDAGRTTMVAVHYDAETTTVTRLRLSYPTQ